MFAELVAASIDGRAALGAGRGARPARIGTPPSWTEPRPPGRGQARSQGFSLHAALVIRPGNARGSNGVDACRAEPGSIGREPADADRDGADRSDGRGRRWAAVTRRTFGVDVLACPRCGGCLRLIALIEDAAVIGRILRHLGLPEMIPSPRPARAPPATPAIGRDDEFALT